jgi:hypothetical protein
VARTAAGNNQALRQAELVDAGDGRGGSQTAHMHLTTSHKLSYTGTFLVCQGHHSTSSISLPRSALAEPAYLNWCTDDSGTCMAPHARVNQQSTMCILLLYGYSRPRCHVIVAAHQPQPRTGPHPPLESGRTMAVRSPRPLAVFPLCRHDDKKQGSLREVPGTARDCSQLLPVRRHIQRGCVYTAGRGISLTARRDRQERGETRRLGHSGKRGNSF